VPLQVLADAKALMADSATVPRGELLGHYHFGEMAASSTCAPVMVSA
jgi:hypothetical protein